MQYPPNDWYYGPRVIQSKTDDGKDSHGSCVASKVAGALNGVSKNSHIIMLKATLVVSDIVWAFSKALDDITAQNRQKKSVVLFAATSTNGDFSTDAYPWTAIKPIMQSLFDTDVAIVVPSGNSAVAPHRYDVDTLPALWESPIFPLIVVGAVDNTGSLVRFSQGPGHVTVSAPGVDVSCAKKDNPSASGTGTSFSAAMVSSCSLRCTQT